MPYPLTYDGINVLYVDRWEPEDNSALFPELGAEATFPQPDIVANLDTDRLGAIDDESVDFVIASHLLEHMADPIGLIEDIYRVLRPGGVHLILLPDRHLTFDRLRNPTDLSHLIAEHAAGVTQVDDSHIEEFILATAPIDTPQSLYLSDDPVERQRQIEVHRHRSVHAHCWDQEEFAPVLHHTIASLGLGWEFVDALLTEEGGADSIEFGFVLRKSISMIPGDVMAARFTIAWTEWRDGQIERLAREKAHFEWQAESTGQLAEARAELDSMRRTKTFRYSEFGRKTYSRIRYQLERSRR